MHLCDIFGLVIGNSVNPFAAMRMLIDNGVVEVLASLLRTEGAPDLLCIVQDVIYHTLVCAAKYSLELPVAVLEDLKRCGAVGSVLRLLLLPEALSPRLFLCGLSATACGAVNLICLMSNHRNTHSLLLTHSAEEPCVFRRMDRLAQLLSANDR